MVSAPSLLSLRSQASIAMIYRLKLQNHVDGLDNTTWSFKPPTILGREPSSGICIEHDSISRKHCQFFQNSEGTLVVKDLESKNGTYVDDVRIQHKTLMPGETVQVGALRFEVIFTTEEEIATKPLVRSQGNFSETQAMKKVDPLPPPPPKSWWARLFD
jgi:pSer/pThr/pTyr-binding forkhead associated (FHA) protein